MVQQLRFHAPNAGGTGLIPGWGTKIPHAKTNNNNNNNTHTHTNKKNTIRGQAEVGLWAVGCGLYLGWV